MKKDTSPKSYIDADGEALEFDAEWFETATVLTKPVKPRHSISLRIDPEVLAWYRAQGLGYQTRMHAVLDAYRLAQSKQPHAASATAERIAHAMRLLELCEDIVAGGTWPENVTVQQLMTAISEQPRNPPG